MSFLLSLFLPNLILHCLIEQDLVFFPYNGPLFRLLLLQPPPPASQRGYHAIEAPVDTVEGRSRVEFLCHSIA